MTRRYEFAFATDQWISPGAVLAGGHTVAADQLAYGGARWTRAVQPFARWLVTYQRAVYLRGTLLAAVLAIGLGGIAYRCRGAWRRGGGERGGPGLYPWLAAVTVLAAPVLTADYSERYVLIAVPLACLAAGLTFARSPAAPGPPDGSTATVTTAGAAMAPAPPRARVAWGQAPRARPADRAGRVAGAWAGGKPRLTERGGRRGAGHRRAGQPPLPPRDTRDHARRPALHP